MPCVHDVRLYSTAPGQPATGSDRRDAVWQGLAQALLRPASTVQDLEQALRQPVTDDQTRWWTASPFEGIKGRRGGLDLLDRSGASLQHDVTTLLGVAAMSPHPWAWPTLVEHWEALYATEGRPSPHPEWTRAEVRRSLVHLASPATLTWWLDPAHADPGRDATADQQALVRAWWRGLTRHLLYGKAENVVVSGNLPPQDVWACFNALREQGLATLQDWSTPRNLAASRMGSHPNARADRALPLGMAPIEAVLALQGSEPVLAAWLAEGGDPNLTNPFSRVALVQRALQSTTPANLQALIEAGASLDVAAGAWERSNGYGRPAGVLGYPWCLLTQRFPTTVTTVRIPPGPLEADLNARLNVLPQDTRCEREETRLGLILVLRWLTDQHAAVRLADEPGVAGVWSSGAWQAWLEQRELRRTGPTDESPSSTLPPDVPTRRRL